jgi:hypothetical protein
MPTAAPNPVALLQSLEPDQLVARLQELDGEARAVRVLLRAARARQRRAPRGTGQQPATEDSRRAS